MIDLSIYAGKTVAVMGLGRSGLAAAEALLAGGAEVRAWDDNAAPRDAAAAAGVPIHDLAAETWDDVGMLVLSPGIPHTWPKPHPVAATARDAGAEIVSDIALLHRAESQAGYIGVTGTNGKSTTTALIGHMMKRAGRNIEVGGNLGIPALALDVIERPMTYVLELSSYQLELGEAIPFDVAVLLNLSPDHLDRHGGMAGYIAAKSRIFEAQRADQTAVVGIDDPHSAKLFDALVAAGHQRVVPISSTGKASGGIYVREGTIYDDTEGDDEPLASLDGIDTLPGLHNAQNASAACAAARAAGLAADEIAGAITSYPGLPHRQETAMTIDGVRYVNDSKATNAEATAKALACYDAIYWIAGGQAKEGGIDAVLPYLPRVRRAYLIGEAAGDMAQALDGLVETDLCGDLDTAIAHAGADAKSDGEDDTVVLLSPTCASFDQFDDFEDRGRAFCRLAAALPGDARDVRNDGGKG